MNVKIYVKCKKYTQFIGFVFSLAQNVFVEFNSPILHVLRSHSEIKKSKSLDEKFLTTHTDPLAVEL